MKITKKQITTAMADQINYLESLGNLSFLKDAGLINNQELIELREMNKEDIKVLKKDLKNIN